MQLKYNKEIKNNIITIELETANFTPQENKMLDEFGEPVLTFSKVYETKFPVQFEKRIRTGFKIKVKFDGTEDLQGATTSANLFFEEIQESLGTLMAALTDRASNADFIVETGIASIKY